jgi:SanA protein
MPERESHSLSCAKGLRIGFLIFILVILLSPLLMIALTFRHITGSTGNLPASYTCLVLGAGVYSDGKPTPVLEQRLKGGLSLYQAGVVKRFLLSGDHGSRHYDEVNRMRDYLLAKGVPEEDLFTDHAGFSTYESVVRARQVFKVTDVTIVSQGYHLPRAVFLARTIGLNAHGYMADGQRSLGFSRNWRREYPALIKALFEVVFRPAPSFLGEEVPITGDSALSLG